MNVNFPNQKGEVRENRASLDQSSKNGRNKLSDQSGQSGNDNSSDQSGKREEYPVEERDKKKKSKNRIQSSSSLDKKKRKHNRKHKRREKHHSSLSEFGRRCRSTEILSTMSESEHKQTNIERFHVFLEEIEYKYDLPDNLTKKIFKEKT